MPFNFYAVFNGRQRGVFASWPACERQVINFPHVQFKGYPTLKAATKAMKAFRKKDVMPPQLKKFGRAIGVDPRISGEDFIAADGACTHSGQAEFQSFLFPDGMLINKMQPFYGTNNIAEFLAIVGALQWCKDADMECPVYSDSLTAISWVSSKRCNTLLEPGKPGYAYTMAVLRDAEKWLKDNPAHNKVMKWETALWGENLADFQRKGKAISK